ncbi:MAG TPA: class II aldolase/adducin family protein [Chthonomonas sp.]|uniref:class II aldolase/adducin family protein n=1 Tax=Chthonomonas sp. TaxID=2282153 RepID=UPI002B4AB1A2|nr:class II aldolase/adducin family protein [Chthonomonas sp.]HLI47358.1 class II aldolase/adducin family protein [Chthonomonas sp.]
MRIPEPYPSLSTLMTLIGEAGQRLAEIEASEGSAGNISVYLGWELDPTDEFPLSEPFPLPTAAPELVGHGFLVTGAGRRLREIIRNPHANLAYLRIEEGGRQGTLYTARERLFKTPTSELNSHIAVHRDQVTRNGLNFHALVHAQPFHLVYLSHIARYQDSLYLSRHVLRWQPESIVNIPDGIGFLPFMLPGSPELMLGNVRMMRDHRIVVWGKHGVLARSDVSVKRACDLIEYAETGARYEYMNLTNHGLADGLSTHELRMICDAFNVDQHIF